MIKGLFNQIFLFFAVTSGIFINIKDNVFLGPKRPILFFVLHPDNVSVEEAVAPKRSGLGYGGVKIIRVMHRKRK